MMKKLLSTILSIIFAVGMCLSLTGCTSLYCDPKGKEWHNLVSLPNISNPFNEIYDGCYSIQIDKDGKVAFKPLNGEVIEGNLSTSFNDINPWRSANISIQFDNGKTGTGKCSKNDTGRTLSINYDRKSYSFSDKRQLSKEEFDIYRSQFIEFLANVYKTGIFPTKQEIENNSLYKQFTNYYQIDPCCGGPIVYDTVEKATIEKIEIKEIENEDDYKEITLNINGESIVCQMDGTVVASVIKNGEIKKLTLSDVNEGECLIVRDSYSYIDNGIEKYWISGIFYMENS